MMGLVSSIQRCSVHDGPGIRTTVFLKGCNLKCAWCHNPETISAHPEILLHPEKCIHCGMCEEGCFSGARVLCGVEMTAEEVVKEVLKDKGYYEGGGGVTVSGGEPTCQAEFTGGILRLARDNGISTAIETNLCCSNENMRKVTDPCDLVMADLKIFDGQIHKKYTGADNAVIKRNLSEVNRPLIVRTPVICGINDTDEEIGNIARFVSEIKTLLYYELLPYHPLGLSKGAGEQERFAAPSKERMKELAMLAKEYCVEVRIAGRVIGC